MVIFSLAGILSLSMAFLGPLVSGGPVYCFCFKQVFSLESGYLVLFCGGTSTRPVCGGLLLFGGLWSPDVLGEEL